MRIIFLLLFLVSVLPAHAQTDTSQTKTDSSFSSYRAAVMQALKDFRKRNADSPVFQSRHLNEDSTYEFSIYPLRHIEVSFKDSNDVHPVVKIDDPDILLIRFTSSRHYYDFHIKNSRVVYFTGARAARYSNFIKTFRNTDLSFFYVLYDNKNLYSDALVTNKGILGYSDGLSFSTNIAALIASKYGSVGKYMSLQAGQAATTEIFKESMKEFDLKNNLPELMKSNWILRSRYLPHDTSGNIDLFMKDIESYAGNRAKRKAIREKIEHSFGMDDPGNQLSPADELALSKKTVMFMRNNITLLLEPILGQTAFDEYYKHYQVLSLRSSEIDIYVYLILQAQQGKGTKVSREKHDNFIYLMLRGNSYQSQ